MSESVIVEINRDFFRKKLLKYTKKAFQMLPSIDKPRILDIGCGSGVPTMELARLSDGEIVGIDINETELDTLEKKIRKEGYSNRIRIVKCSLSKINFPDNSFDIIWAEGSIAVIGFEKGLKEWNRLLKPKGFLILHDEVKDLADRMKKIPKSGYKLQNYFILPKDAWWEDYYAPLEKHITKLRIKYRSNPEALKILDQRQNEINMVKANPDLAVSIFYVMQKT